MTPHHQFTKKDQWRDADGLKSIEHLRSIGFLRGRERGIKAGLALLILVTAVFIALPIVSLFVKSLSTASFRSLLNPVVVDALKLSLLTSSLTAVIVITFGTPISYVNARFPYPGKDIVDSLIDLPVIMPPAVAGIALLMAFGRMGILGQHLSSMGISIPFTTIAVVIAQIFVSAPFFLRQAKTSFEDVDPALEGAARTLGASSVYTFIYVTMPMAFNGLLSGSIMTFARSLGEFGATIMFAGNFQGRTQTMTLAIYTAMQGDLNVSLCLAVILVVVSFSVIAIVKLLSRRMYKNARN